MLAERGRVSATRPERRQLLEHTGRRGSEAGRAASDRRLTARVQTLGFVGVGDHLRDRHAAGWSVVRISAELTVARRRPSGCCRRMGLPGVLDAALPSRSQRGAGSGPRTWPGWLRAQHAAGLPAAVSARALGHSTAWWTVRARRGGLADLLTPPLTVEQRLVEVVRDGGGLVNVGDHLAHRRAAGATSIVLQAGTGMAPHRLAKLLRGAGANSTTEMYERRPVDAVGFPDQRGYAQGSRCCR